MQAAETAGQENIYFEQQQLRRCGLHAVNNLLGKQAYTPEAFDQLAIDLKSKTNLDHRSWLGNYDYNLMEAALLRQNIRLEWFKPNSESLEDILKKEELRGFIFNLHREANFFEKLCRWDPNHWISIRKIENDLFIYLDSKNDSYEKHHSTDIIKKIAALKNQSPQNHLILAYHKS